MNQFVLNSMTVVCLSWSLMGVGGSISSSSSSSSSSSGSLDRDFFDDDSNDMFDQMEKEDRFHEALDEGFDTWEERCLKVGGQAVLDDWLQAQEHLVYCVMSNFDMAKIQRQIDMTDKKKNLNLDVVFKEHCGEPVTKTRPCIEDFLEASRGCVGDDEDRNSLNITMHMIDAAVEFVCYNNGGRLALFMSESGMDCMKTHQDGIMKCVDSSAPELFHKRSKNNINAILFDAKNCRKGDKVRECIEKELLECDDPTPSNVVNSMMLAMKDATPCKQISSRYASSADSHSFPSGPLGLFQSLLVGLFVIVIKSLSS